MAHYAFSSAGAQTWTFTITNIAFEQHQRWLGRFPSRAYHDFPSYLYDDGRRYNAEWNRGESSAHGFTHRR